MAQNFNAYDPIFYANESLMQLRKALGMAGRVYRGYDKAPQQKGSTISIRKPGTFTAQNAPSLPQDIDAPEVQIKLDQWKDVPFKLTDKDLSATGEVIIQEHIAPAAYAIADAIDQSLNGLYADIPWFYDIAATAGVADVTAVNQIMFDNKVPLIDASMIHWEVDSDMKTDLLNQSAFTQWQGSGQAGVNAQVTGDIGMRYGFNFFANQNVARHTKGTLSATTAALVGAHAKGAKQVTIDAGTLTGTLKKGDTFVVAGHAQRYAVTADATASANQITVAITPVLAIDYPDNAQVTVSLDDHSATLAFHRNAFALAMAPLSTMGQELGSARMAVATDPVTNLSLRSTLWYDGGAAAVNVRIDALWGAMTLDPNLAVRGRN
ncbi:P22 phage major capsid protein family protein [Azospirillum brasilense]|uniref:P22 phage major capsid protein family protein n=1 Tax=Azospirillum brasilense TaxID=192 RepID=UPI000E69131E|nr:P22 phage major capsid protein family protein [Azospirillum brasilense]NUB27214.1 hypothetical protein [Azospirillum brasilense]NUB30546.1 hypothetical protein [Azospirillum brasilense]RIW07774.1 hypothetical protein D2T81_02740 [Azospirillum brasilense]